MSSDKIKVSIIIIFAASLQKTILFLGNQGSLLGRQYIFLQETVISIQKGKSQKIAKSFFKTHF